MIRLPASPNMCSVWFFVLFTFALAGHVASSNSSHWVSFWFSCDSTYPRMIEAVAAHTNAVSSVILDCGMYLDGNATIVIPTNSNCKSAVTDLSKLGVKAELAIGLANSSIFSMRTAMHRGPKSFSEQLLTIVDQYKVKGIDFDWEPQGADSGNLADAKAYADFLSDIRQSLSGIARLTICVADWSPVMSQYALLAPAVDRLLDMQTYNDNDYPTWYGYYKNIVKDSVPREKVGIGMYPFGTNGTWPATPRSVMQRMEVIKKDAVAEVFIFRLLFQGEQVWPFPMWWNPLQQFLEEDIFV